MKKTKSKKTVRNLKLASKQIQVLYRAALKARTHSHSPYSGCKVGAALFTSQGKIYSGCNVENASYGGAICAERTAIVKAISDHGKIKIAALLVVTEGESAWPPCGICLQFMSEFTHDAPVYLSTTAGFFSTYRFSELLPVAFRSDFMANDANI
jgi:cytidine deaminase